MLRYLPLLFAAISLPCALRLVPPNNFYGWRTDASFMSEEAWYHINMVGGIAGVVAGLAGYFVNRRIDAGALPPRDLTQRHLLVFIAVAIAMAIPGIVMR